MRAWLNGRLVSPEEACISPFDRGFLLGDGVFETIPVYRGRPFDLGAHLARLKVGLELLGFAAAIDLPAVSRDICVYVAAEAVETAVLRVTVTRGQGPRGLAPPAEPQPTIVLTWSPPPVRRAAPVAACIARTTRRNEASPLSRVKVLPYLDNMLALREAQAKGCEEALLLNTRGTLACASVANVIVLRGDCLITPPITDGALPGTLRALVLPLAVEIGLACAEQSLAPEDLADADQVLLANSVRGIVELGQIDGRGLARRAVSTVSRLRDGIAARIAADCG